jgi:hypothetical protein
MNSILYILYICFIYYVLYIYIYPSDVASICADFAPHSSCQVSAGIVEALQHFWPWARPERVDESTEAVGWLTWWSSNIWFLVSCGYFKISLSIYIYIYIYMYVYVYIYIGILGVEFPSLQMGWWYWSHQAVLFIPADNWSDWSWLKHQTKQNVSITD